MKKFLSIFFVLFSSTAFAQEPAMFSLKGYGGNIDDEIATRVTKTADGGFIVCLGTNSTPGTGNIDSFCALGGNRNIFLKYNADASVLEWSKCSVQDADSQLAYMFPTADGGAVFGGEFTSGNGWGFLICKENAVGNIVWQRNYSKGNGSLLRDMIATNDGGYIVSGQCYNTDSNVIVHYGSWMTADIWVLKLDSSGNKVWSKVIGGSEDEHVYSIVAGPNEGCYIVGTTESSDYDCTGYHAGGGDVYLARLDSNGNILWHHDLGGSGDDEYYGWGTEDGKGGVLIAAGSNSTDGDVHHHIGDYDIWALEVDSSNNILWDNCYGGISGEAPNAICKANDGSIWIAGYSNIKTDEVDTSYGQGDAWIVHADSVGNFLSAKVLGGSEADEGSMIYPLSNNFVLVGGYYTANTGSFSSLIQYGGGGTTDAFLAVFAPWSVSVPKLSQQIYIKVFPNPANESVQIKWEQQNASGWDITINDIFGRQVFAEYEPVGTVEISANVSAFAKGVYYVQMTSDDGYRSVQKFVVQ